VTLRWLLVTTMTAAALAAPAGQPGAPRVYVSNERAATVTVIDTGADKVLRQIKIGPRPRGIEVLGRRLFVALSDDDPHGISDRDAIAVADVDTGAILARHDAGSDPERLVLDRAGTRLYAANEDAGTATITDLKSGKVLATLVVGIEPEGVAISPDDRWVYVTAETSNTVSVIDTRALKVVSNFLVDPRPRDAAFSPDGTRAYVTAEIGGSVSVIDVAQHRVIATIELPETAKPVGVVVSPDNRFIYVANGHGNSVAFIDADSAEGRGHRARRPTPVGDRPHPRRPQALHGQRPLG
jgi:YVTN family beta-propeller protein